MEVWLLLLLIGLTLGAPFTKEGEARKYADEDVSLLVKRAQEAIMFGNQQNPPKLKRGDPNVPTLSDDDGSVRALPPQDISEPVPMPEDDSEIQETIPADDISAILTALDNKITESEVENEVKAEDGEGVPLAEGGEKINEKDNQIGADESLDQTDEILTSEENKFADNDEKREMLELPGAGSYEAESDQEADYYNNLMRWLAVADAHREYPANLDNSIGGYHSRYRRYQPHLRNMQAPMVKSGSQLETEVKRSHRTKRDLLFPEDERSSYYLSPDESEAIYGESPLPYGESPEALSMLNDPYYDLLETENPTFGEELDEEEYENIKPIVYHGRPGYFVPAKRSGFRSFTPGNKRDQYFYPSSEEPQTHWGAFIPSKRENTDSYANLVRLARKLAMREVPREVEGYRGYSWE